MNSCSPLATKSLTCSSMPSSSNAKPLTSGTECHGNQQTRERPQTAVHASHHVRAQGRDRLRPALEQPGFGRLRAFFSEARPERPIGGPAPTQETAAQTASTAATGTQLYRATREDRSRKIKCLSTAYRVAHSPPVEYVS